MAKVQKKKKAAQPKVGSNDQALVNTVVAKHVNSDGGGITLETRITAFGRDEKVVLAAMQAKLKELANV